MKRFFLAAAAALSVLAPARAELPGVVGQDVLINASAGDDLYQMARRYAIALDHIAFANDLPIEIKLQKDARLRLPIRRILPREHPATGLLINLPERGAFFYYNNRYYGFFPIAIGKPGRFETPLGKYKIDSMQKNPTWIPPEWADQEKAVLPGPDNPLGDRWVGLTAPGIGVHATNAPESVGGAVSHGCMRTYPRTIHQVFPYLAKKMDAWIVYESVKWGRDDQGRLNVQVFPDVYNKRKPLPELRKLAEEDIPMSFVQQLVQKPDGIAKVVKW